ncbi:hypothetical protein Pcinc_024255 [Petrolisthes cinctipes]|uniref:Uncharacterized protein n=1 Tax=Petrolisthes cinctipes TaxID=88211 RepID=A0AAE1FD32_PETCI|nr:hypothetical protein Pcinc_024255 [Petrolisthes cinctipes]
MNYAYDNFETEENGVNARRQGGVGGGGGGGSSSGSSRPRVSSSSSYGRMNGGSHSNGYHHAQPQQAPSSHPYGDTRSLQRPRHAPPQTRQDPRSTYSLPRGASGSLPSYNTAMQDMTPDFYYLPSQRKYSGEVVRVYVDYNDPNDTVVYHYCIRVEFVKSVSVALIKALECCPARSSSVLPKRCYCSTVGRGFT